MFTDFCENICDNLEKIDFQEGKHEYLLPWSGKAAHFVQGLEGGTLSTPKL